MVFLSTHSKQDKVGLLRFCFFLGGSPVPAWDAVPLLPLLLPSRPPAADVTVPSPPPGLLFTLTVTALPAAGDSDMPGPAAPSASARVALPGP